MAEYIEREALLKVIKSSLSNIFKVASTGDRMHLAIKQVAESVPAADVAPVVRCRECKHYREIRTKRHWNLIRSCTRMGKHDMDYPVKPDDFCSYGERSTD